MKTGTGILNETYLNRNAAGWILCPAGLIPAPGQYLLASNPLDINEILPVPIFPAGSAAGGFLAAPPLPRTWQPGTSLNLRGPLGKGFSLPLSARAVALVAMGETSARLGALLEPALKQRAAVVLLCSTPPHDLPAEVEIMPISSLKEVAAWADYLAFDLPRAAIPTILGSNKDFLYSREAQALITAPMPCGGMGECGVCAVVTKRGPKLACKDGPVFDLKYFTGAAQRFEHR
jgi:dihydroorotate dehydrogenase electron transfer subunit